MIKNWLVSGDTHGLYNTRLHQLREQYPELIEEETALIILGDLGANFWLNKRDNKNKELMKKHYGYWIYALRGNHCERPSNLGYEKIYDDNVKGFVYIDPINPKLRYFLDEGGEYQINNYKILTVPGAYSVDKYYRLEREAQGSYGGWFPQEQLSQEEMDNLLAAARNKHYNFILTHTCPWSWEPRDLFLSCVDQSKVDDSMEIWMDELKDSCSWDVWLAGHFHDDRILAPHAQMLMHDIKFLDDIYDYWD